MSFDWYLVYLNHQGEPSAMFSLYPKAVEWAKANGFAYSVVPYNLTFTSLPLPQWVNNG